MKKNYLKSAMFITVFVAGTAVISQSKDVYAAYDVDTDPYFENDMNLYCQYVDSHELEDFLDGRDGIFGDASMLDIHAQRVKVADFDGDNRAEVWVTGPSASANSIAGILDVSNEEVKCVFNGWGKEWGRYTDPETGQTGLVIAEGNSDGEGYTHTRESLYDENWDSITLLETENNGIESTDINTNDEVYEQIRSNCTETESVAEIESDNMDKQEIISFLQSLTSTSTGDTLQEEAITSYPAYDEIIRKYYEGMASGWSMEDFRENDLCYLAGYEMGESSLGYCTMDINGDGIEELMIGSVNENAYTGMFFDLYTIVDGQISLVISSGERDRYYLCEDYTIANEGSGGALSSVSGYYDLISDQLQLKEGVFMDGYDHSDNPWFYTSTNIYEDYSTPISESEAQGIMDKYTYMTLPYVPLDEINTQDDNTEVATETATETQTLSIRQQAEQEIAETEQRAIAAETGNEQYELWDDCLNRVWSYLKETLSLEDMEALTNEELDWITEKEETVNSMTTLSEGEILAKAAELTKERVYELFNRLP